MLAVSNRMNDISNIFEQLSFISRKAKDNKVVSDTYGMMKNIMSEWGNTYIKQKEMIDMDMREYLNYWKRELICFKDVRTLLLEYFKN